MFVHMGWKALKGTSLAVFQSAAYGTDYLHLDEGEEIFVFPESQTEGWVMAQKCCSDGVEIGWVPASYCDLADTSAALQLFALEPLVLRVFQYVTLFEGQYNTTLSRIAKTLKQTSSTCLMCIRSCEADMYEASLAKASEVFPSVVADVARYGRPVSVLPLPTWRLWRVDVWWRYPNGSRAGRGWELAEVHWISELHLLHQTYENSYLTAGLYENLRMELSSWTWQYHDRQWMEEYRV